jgi:hypothetical protein
MPALVTDWKEVIPADEAARFEEYARQILAIQAGVSAKQGKGRALHRKQVLAVRGEFQTLALPAGLQHGLFAAPVRKSVIIRLSNGAPKNQSHGTPDIRGFAIKVKDVRGPSALGQGETNAQDFLLINHATFTFPDVAAFMGLVVAFQKGPLGLLPYLVKTYGFGQLFPMLKKLGAVNMKKFTGFATENFYSAAPISWGPLACKLRLVPAQTGGAKGKDWPRDMAERLRKGPLKFELQAQFFEDEATTPIEDHSVEWKTPFVPVAELLLPMQDLASPESAALQTEAEEGRFDPWCALEAHRPLGNVMRARKIAYFASANARKR